MRLQTDVYDRTASSRGATFSDQEETLRTLLTKDAMLEAEIDFDTTVNRTTIIRLQSRSCLRHLGKALMTSISDRTYTVTFLATPSTTHYCVPRNSDLTAGVLAPCYGGLHPQFTTDT